MSISPSRSQQKKPRRATYWRRRFITLVIGLAVFAVIAWALSGSLGTGAATARTGTASSAAGHHGNSGIAAGSGAAAAAGSGGAAPGGSGGAAAGGEATKAPAKATEAPAKATKAPVKAVSHPSAASSSRTQGKAGSLRTEGSRAQLADQPRQFWPARAAAVPGKRRIHVRHHVQVQCRRSAHQTGNQGRSRQDLEFG